MATNRIIEESRAHRRQWNVPAPGPSSEAEVERAQAAFVAKFGVALPHEYAAFLRLSNGLKGDGIELYGATPWRRQTQEEWPTIDGLLEAHEAREQDGIALRDLVVMGTGEAGILYGFELRSRRFVQHDLCGNVTRAFESFEEMFCYMFEGRV